ncbi:MAG TPA: hypothetical protein VK550_34445 [Polyangiaceae bacterium]|nr:hypothetical protein [Polyangiaceae bacterium]
MTMTGCAVYDDTSRTSSGSTAATTGSGGATSGPSGGSAGSGGIGAKDGSSGASGDADAGGAAGKSGTSGAGGFSDADSPEDGGGIAGAGGTSGIDATGGAGGTSGAAGTSGSGGAAGASGTSGSGGTSGGDGSSGADSSSGIDHADAGQPCVVGTGPSNLPFAVDPYFVASGWMQAALIRQEASCLYPPPADAGAPTDAARDGTSTSDAGTVPPLPGSKCWTITYAPTAPTDWAGVDWQYPINNWGADAGLVIPPGAARVSVVAWGDTGTEMVTFQVGYGAASPDGFGASLTDQPLTTTPTRYAVNMSGIAYTCNSVRMGFGWVATGGTTMTFHLADVRWE